MPDAERFEALYAGSPPWEIGRPQPEVVRVADDGEFRGDVLDVGCGSGENALFLASRGFPVVGVDFSPTAIARAQAKAVERSARATFLVHDALELGALRHRFTTALDSGLFHLLGDDERRRYAESVAEAVGSGGTLHLLCFSDEEPPGDGPRRVSQREIRDAFRGPFVATRIRAARLTAQTTEISGWLATLVRV